MKKNVIVFVTALTIIILFAFGFNTKNDSVNKPVEISNSTLITSDKKIERDYNFSFFPDFFYKVDTRFRGVKKGMVDNAKSVTDFLPKEHTQSIVSYKSVSVTILEDTKQTGIKETGTSELLTAAQIKLLRSTDYSTNILIRADYQNKNEHTGKLQNNYSTPYLTIVPEKQAMYENGKNALIEYLKENSKVETAYVQKNILQPGRLFFTVSKNGVISDVTLGATSGYPAIDKKMIQLMYEAPGKWKPAENLKGEKVDQELVFSFGEVGC